MEERLHRRRAGGLSFLMGGVGEPLLLLHGIPGSAESWLMVGMRLANRFRVIIPDLLGFGASEAAPAASYMEDQARAVRQLLAHLRITELYLGGHDFGGPVALTLLRLFPELSARGLILSATNLFTDTRLPLSLRIARTPGLSSLFFWGMAGNRLGLRLLYNNAARNKEDIPWRRFRRHLTRSGIAQTRYIFQRSLSNLRANYQELEGMLPHLTCPSLVIWGDEDPFLAVDVGERLRATLPDAILKVYAFTGHFVPEERPIETAEDIILRFT
ncbi:MAG TPA: alpha/beta hydrolase [Caldilineaceae bacterium]|nr:alpha/beta hydrolase [Caldilineaceae bacterium]